MARRLAARDTDSGDEVTGWAIVGGADRSAVLRSLSDTGELSFREAPDYEDSHGCGEQRSGERGWRTTSTW